jgi:ABC-type lipoprotein export system ATPase subunit
LIELVNVTVAYRQGTSTVTPLHQVDATFPSGVSALMGPSGSGKSTLLRLIAGMQRADKGKVAIDGKAVQPPTRRNAGDPRVALIPQDYRLVDFLSVEENLRLCAELHSRALEGGDVADLLEQVGLAGYSTRAPGTLSGGEQQRVAIARGMAAGARVILADEPTGPSTWTTRFGSPSFLLS